MIDPLERELADRVAAATPSTLPPFDEIRRRARQHRLRTTVIVAASTALVAGVAVGSWALQASDPVPRPHGPATSPPPSEDSSPARPDPTYDSSQFPSGLVIRLPEGDVDLPADTSCWTVRRDCRRGLLPPGSPVPQVGSGEAVDFWFARPGWSFQAIFRREGEVCPRATTVSATRTGDQWFRLTPADQAGPYEVELYGQGPEGAVSSRFRWATTSDGPVDPAQAAVSLTPESRGEGSYGLEVTVEDLAFQPTRSDLSSSVEVTVTSADGRVTLLTAPLISPSLDCGPGGARGSFYYQREWLEDVSVLGRSPLTLEVALTIRGTTHVGTTTWHARGRSPYRPLAVEPPLPASGVG